MYHLMIQMSEGTKPQDLLTYLRALGVTRVIFPSRKYGKPVRRPFEPEYETARLLPRGGDGGFAEEWLASRDT